jgi:hypothetical protein
MVTNQPGRSTAGVLAKSSNANMINLTWNFLRDNITETQMPAFGRPTPILTRRPQSHCLKVRLKNKHHFTSEHNLNYTQLHSRNYPQLNTPS